VKLKPVLMLRTNRGNAEYSTQLEELNMETSKVIIIIFSIVYSGIAILQLTGSYIYV
jgi:hypothetical protein